MTPESFLLDSQVMRVSSPAGQATNHEQTASRVLCRAQGTYTLPWHRWACRLARFIPFHPKCVCKARDSQGQASRMVIRITSWMLPQSSTIEKIPYAPTHGYPSLPRTLATKTFPAHDGFEKWEEVYDNLAAMRRDRRVIS